MSQRRTNSHDYNDIPLHRYVRGSRDGFDTVEYIVDKQTKQPVFYIDSRDSYADIMLEIAQHHRYLEREARNQ